MSKQWLELRKDWDYKKLGKWLLIRSVFVSGRALGWLVRETIKGVPVAIELLAQGTEKVALVLTKVTPSIRKWAVLSQVWVDEVFAVPDRGIQRILKEVDAIPYGGRYIEVKDDEGYPLTRIEQVESLEGWQISVEDVPKAIANYDGSVLIACRPGAGKTTTMLSSVENAGDADFWIFDGKGSAWNGREKNPERYFLCNHPNLIPRAVEAFNHLVTVEMKGRQDTRLANGGTHPTKPRRIIVVCDEFNNIVTFAQMAKLADELCNLVTLIINLGREDLVNWWGVAQTHLVGEINLSTGVQKGLAFVCQGRDTQYQSIEGALSDRNIVANPDERKRLQQQLAYYAQNEPDQSQPICFTTIGGKRLVKLPKLSPSQNGLTPVSIQSQAVPPNGYTQMPNGLVYNHTESHNGHNPVLTAVQPSLEKTPQDPPGLTENQGFQLSETGFSGTAGSAEIALLEGILGILTDPNGSRDKAAKWIKENYSMGYQRARAIVDSVADRMGGQT
jgi:hypothetical protein